VSEKATNRETEREREREIGGERELEVCDTIKTGHSGTFLSADPCEWNRGRSARALR